MRNELENIERIEKFLRNELSADDKRAFEEQLKTDESLQSQVAQQRDAVNGIERLGAKASIQTAYKKYNFRKNGLKFGLGSILVLALASSFIWNSTSPEDTDQEQAKKNATVDLEQFMPEVQSFDVDPNV